MRLGKLEISLLFLVLAACATDRAPNGESVAIAPEVPSALELQDNYKTSRLRFIASARKLKREFPRAILSAHTVPVPGDSELFIDALFIPAQKKAKNLIVLTAGIHGVEAVAGSLQERYIMEQCVGSGPADAQAHRGSSINLNTTSLLIVHNMNPFGFKYGRRFNVNNVDLNRNCFDYRKKVFPGKEIKNEAYSRYRNFFESEISGWGVLTRGISNKNELTRALSGQYEFPKGFYYGGDQVEFECETVQKLIAPHVDTATNILHVDFHTGLGEKGISQIMLNPPPKDPEAFVAYDREVTLLKDTLFPKAECRGVCAVEESSDHAFLTSGDITQWLHNRYPQKRLKGTVIALTSEIGSKGALTVLPALVNENYCFQHKEACPTEKLQKRTQHLKKVFIPTDKSWGQQVIRGAEQMCRALSRFSSL